MNEPPGLPAALGIEAVEWLGQGADTLTVRVRGRWRRRRGTPSGQPLLVIEVEGTRHRFPAMPEPPSPTGAAPGTWQVSFSVPAEVLEPPGARAWLQIGSVVVPLPVPVESAQQSPGHEPRQPDEETLAQRRIRAAELAAEAAARRVAEAQSTVRALQARIEALEDELGQATALADDRSRAIRAAAQREHAERVMRQELEERLRRVEEAAETEDEDERDLRISELERELNRVRRRVDEAEHLATSADAARRRAERRVKELSEQSAPVVDAVAVVKEFAVAAAASAIEPAHRAAPSIPAGDAQRLRQEQHVKDRRAGIVMALRQELELRQRVEAELRAQLAAATEQKPAPAEPEPRPAPAEPDPALRSTLAELRTELAYLRSALEAESAARAQAEQRVARAYEAIQEVRDELERIRRADREPPSPGLAAGVEAERLSAALARLRESTPQPEDEPGAPPGPWLAKALRAISRRDPDGAVRLLAAMLPATPTEARLARRLLVAGPVRRRLRRGGARIRGHGRIAARLDELMRTPVRFSELRLEPRSALLLASGMIDPAWTGNERFTIACDAGPYLHIRGNDPPLVTDASLGAASTTIVSEPDQVSAVLAGRRPVGTVIRGDERPLRLVREWLDRAQSG